MTEKKAELAKRFASARVVKGAKAFHRFVPLDSHYVKALKLSTRSVVGTPCAPLKVPMRSGCVLPLCLGNTESCSYCFFFNVL